MEFAALGSLAFIASITPGPNNLMLWASGLNHGVRNTLRHLAGVNVGFSLLLFVVAVGLGSAFERWPAFELTLKLTGGAYLLYLAYRIFTTAAIGQADTRDRPLTFTQAALFQWVNPKAWVMATTASSTGLGGDTPLLVAALALTALFAAINLPCITVWMVSGSYASRFVHDEARLRMVNRVLGVLLAGTVAVLVT